MVLAHCINYNCLSVQDSILSKGSEVSMIPSDPEIRYTMPSTHSPNLLTIPTEIRFRIYHYVLLSHPVSHKHLAQLSQPSTASSNREELPNLKSNTSSSLEDFSTPISIPGPWSPQPHELVSIQKFLIHRSHKGEILESHVDRHTKIDASITRSRFGQHKIPSSLLVSCKQIHDEAHLLPWT